MLFRRQLLRVSAATILLAGAMVVRAGTTISDDTFESGMGAWVTRGGSLVTTPALGTVLRLQWWKDSAGQRVTDSLTTTFHDSGWIAVSYWCGYSFPSGFYMPTIILRSGSAVCTTNVGYLGYHNDPDVWVHRFTGTDNSITFKPGTGWDTAYLDLKRVILTALGPEDTVPDSSFLPTLHRDTVSAVQLPTIVRLHYGPIPLPTGWLLVRALPSPTLASTDMFGFSDYTEGELMLSELTARGLLMYTPTADTALGFWYGSGRMDIQPFAPGELKAFSFEPFRGDWADVSNGPAHGSTANPQGHTSAGKPTLYDLRGRPLSRAGHTSCLIGVEVGPTGCGRPRVVR